LTPRLHRSHSAAHAQLDLGRTPVDRVRGARCSPRPSAASRRAAAVVTALFDSAKTGFELSLGLTGIMSLWLGLMKIAEKGGITELIARLGRPAVPSPLSRYPRRATRRRRDRDERSANMLGLDNAGHTARAQGDEELQSLNPVPDTASNDMILFMVHERLVGDAGADLDPYVPRAARRRESRPTSSYRS
jgi:hypothetical protein